MKLNKCNIAELENGKSKASCKETIKRVEKMTEFSSILIIYITGIPLTVPKPFFSYFLYFTTDLGNDAFELVCSAW